MTTISYTIEKTKGTTANVYAITKWTEDHALDCDAAAVTETNDVLATLISDLINQGIIKGSVTTS
jgi:hypothetical protein